MINSNQELLDDTYQAYIIDNEVLGWESTTNHYRTVAEKNGKRMSIYRHIPANVPLPTIRSTGINAGILFAESKEIWDTAFAPAVSPEFVADIEQAHNWCCYLERRGSREWVNKHLLEDLIALAKKYGLVFNHEKPKWGVNI